MDQTQEPIKIHHQSSEQEEEEHHENGATKMFRKVKAKAKKIKNSLTKHGQSHEHDRDDRDVVEEDDEDDEFEPEAIGATDNTRSGVTSQPESLNHPREANVPAPEEIIPPGIKVFPVVSSDYTKPIEAAPLQDASYGHEAITDSVRTTESGADLGKEFPTERREFDQKVQSGRNGNSPTEFGGGLGAPTEGNSPVESQEVCLKNESEIRKDLSTGFGRESSKDCTAKGSLEYGDPKENFFTTRNDNVKVETELGRDVPTGIHDQFSPELSYPKERDDFEETRDDFEETTQETKPSTYTEQFTSVVNAVTSKLGYSGEKPVKDETEVADEKLSSVDEKNRETESTKLPFSGDGSGVERKDYVEDKGVSAKDYLSEKLTPGQEDKALSEVLAEKLKIGGGEEEKKEMEVKVEKSENSETIAAEEKGAGGGYVGMIKGWFGGGATEEVKPKSPHSVQESPQSLDTTVGTKDLSDFGGNELGETDGRGGVVPVQRGL